MFIGTHEVKTTEIDGEFTKVIFADDLDARIKTEVLEAIETEEMGKGSYVENITFYFAKRFLAELAINELPCSYVDNVSTYMGNLTDNVREELMDKTFGCKGGSHAIPLNILFK